MPAMSADPTAAADRPTRWSLTAKLFAVLLLQNSPSSRPITQTAPTRSDHDLLVEVERALDRQTPAALEPMTLLVEDMSRTNNNPSARLHKEQPNHVN